MGTIETGAELFDLLHDKTSNLHLRAEDKGRDNALYDALKARLGCAEAGVGLRSFLVTKKITVEAFLRAFLGAIEPLSAMYREIYDGMRSAHVSGAGEVSRVAVGEGDTVEELGSSSLRGGSER